MIGAGAVLGTTAALLCTLPACTLPRRRDRKDIWAHETDHTVGAAQGVVVMSYPLESERGITFAMQWSLLNIGAALGGLITLIQTLQSGDQQAVGTGTYTAFVVIVIGQSRL